MQGNSSLARLKSSYIFTHNFLKHSTIIAFENKKQISKKRIYITKEIVSCRLEKKL